MGFDLNGRWAVVTGASAGIGRQLATVLASHGTNLVLVARREGLLNELSHVLTTAHEIKTRIIAMDLTKPLAHEVLAERVRDLKVQVIVNNAGFALTGRLEGQDWTSLSKMIDLNIRFMVGFCHMMVARMRELNEPCRILNLGSVAGYQGVPFFAAYAASKAFVNNFSEGLAWELRDTQIKVTCLQPGQTATEFFKVADMEGSKISKSQLSTAGDVARTGISTMVNGRESVVVGMMNKIKIFSLRFSPRWSVRLVIQHLFRDLDR